MGGKREPNKATSTVLGPPSFREDHSVQQRKRRGLAKACSCQEPNLQAKDLEMLVRTGLPGWVRTDQDQEKEEDDTWLSQEHWLKSCSHANAPKSPRFICVAYQLHFFFFFGQDFDSLITTQMQARIDCPP